MGGRGAGAGGGMVSCHDSPWALSQTAMVVPPPPHRVRGMCVCGGGGRVGACVCVCMCVGGWVRHRASPLARLRPRSKDPAWKTGKRTHFE